MKGQNNISMQTRIPIQYRDIIGHGEVIERLERIATKGCVPHALIFDGPSGIGKRLVARGFATRLLARTEAISEADVTLVRKGNHPDLHLIGIEEDKKDISVEQVRTLIEALSLKPYYGNASVAVIDNAHRMSLAASNALLKTLEEPIGHSFLILVTAAAHRLPPTILSRCQLVRFGELSDQEIHAVLAALLSRLELKERAAKIPLKSLESLALGTLERLQLEQHIDQQSLTVQDGKAFLSHLEEIVEGDEAVKTKVETLLSGEFDQRREALHVASELGAAKELQPMLWGALHAALRKELRTAPTVEATAKADLLLASLAAEKLVTERNLNPQLQLSSLLMRAATRDDLDLS